MGHMASKLGVVHSESVSVESEIEECLHTFCEECIKLIYHCSIVKSRHENQEIIFHYSTCNCLICRDCTYIDHKDHQYNFVSKLLDTAREKVEEAAIILRQHLDLVRNSLAKIKDTYNELNNETDVEKQI